MARTSSTFRMADRLAEGHLADLLADYVAAGRSWDDIARRLFAEAGIEASGPTIAKWARKLGLERPEKASA